MRAYKTPGYIRIEHDGRGTSYPVSRYTAQTAWADFWRTLRAWEEAHAND
ncbi:hypothetical protein [Pseudoflavonifractor phocaeensis]|nr:hypothetical protein [Pseudoflavonifractor phocaeensis]MBM6887623.1 hypothetical protein [Pseudoflavonifractor phocaeensis]